MQREFSRETLNYMVGEVRGLIAPIQKELDEFYGELDPDVIRVKGFPAEKLRRVLALFEDFGNAGINMLRTVGTENQVLLVMGPARAMDPLAGQSMSVPRPIGSGS